MKRLDSPGNVSFEMTVMTLPAPASLECEAPTLVTRSGALLHRVRAAAAAVWRLAPGRYLAIPDGDDVVVLPLGRLTRIGRRATSDIVLDDSTVSRRHALVLDRGGWPVIADDRSLNGVFVNGRRVQEARLVHGDEVRIGDRVMRYVEVTNASNAGRGDPSASRRPQS
jgi:pSer/pThr/pTyr-binding forkhead associated (FHA) protein